MTLEQITAHASPNEIDFGLSVNIDRNCAGCRLTFETSDAFQRLGFQCSQITALEDVAPPIRPFLAGKP